MKTFSLLNLLLLTQLLTAQNFTEIIDIPFRNIIFSSFEFSDIDNDQDEDLLMFGNEGHDFFVKMYVNDGKGEFSEKPDTPFEALQNVDFKFADVDNDNDLDLMITGSYPEYPYSIFSKLYTNDGKGNFTLFDADSFKQIDSGSIDFADIDGDNDLDLLMMGLNYGFPRQNITVLYVNDGSGNFSEKTDNPFISTQGKVDLNDIDNDGDPDVIIDGFHVEMLNYQSQIYINDSQGNFSLREDFPFESETQFKHQTQVIDIDNDGDQDILRYYNGDEILYLNNGNGIFIEREDKLFEGEAVHHTDFFDFDNDGDPDALLTRLNLSDPNIKETKLFNNDGAGNFTEARNITIFNEIELIGRSFSNSTAFSDIDNDGDIDILLVDENNTGFPAFRLFLNEQNMTSINETEDLNANLWYLNTFNTNGTTQIIYHSTEQTDIQISIIDALSRIQSKMDTNISYGVNRINLIDDNLSKGIYFIQIKNKTAINYLKWLVP